MTVTLTKLESEILAHRLEVPECISECIHERFQGFEMYDNRIDDACRAILAMVRKCVLPESAPEGQSELWSHILGDAVEGSTYYGSAKSEGKRKANAVLTAGDNLAKKVTQWCKSHEPEVRGRRTTLPGLLVK
jgi:hypothetical protein